MLSILGKSMFFLNVENGFITSSGLYKVYAICIFMQLCIFDDFQIKSSL